MVTIAVWKQIPYNFIFFLSGLQAIPKSLREAGAIDCRSGFRRFRTIILPLLAPTAFFLLIINMTYSLFDTFGIIDVVVKDKAANNPITLVYKVYMDGFRGGDIGGSLGPVGDPDGHRVRAHHLPVPLHRAARALQLRARHVPSETLRSPHPDQRPRS